MRVKARLLKPPKRNQKDFILLAPHTESNIPPRRNPSQVKKDDEEPEPERKEGGYPSSSSEVRLG